MTDSALTTARQRPSTPLRRALALEWHRHRDRLLLFAVLSVVIGVIAVVLDVRLGWVALLLAARLPADLADRFPDEGRQLRSALGISRADAVRARTLVVCGGQLLLALGAAAAILLTDWPPDERHWASFDVRQESGLAPTPMALVDHLVDIGLWSGALLWTHALVGGSAFRLGERLSAIGALASFLGACLLAGLVVVASSVLVGWALPQPGPEAMEALETLGAPQFVLAARSGQAIALLVALGGGALALTLAHRRWRRRA
ncbi:MAG: hypothetical protein ACTHV2_11130 [Brachybacterium sp.]